MSRELLDVKAERETLRDQLRGAEGEARAARDAAARQAADMERERQEAARHLLDVEGVRVVSTACSRLLC